MLMVILRVPRRSPRGTLGAPRMLNLPVGPAVDFLLMTATVTFLPTRLAPLEGPPFLPLGDASCAFLASKAAWSSSRCFVRRATPCRCGGATP